MHVEWTTTWGAAVLVTATIGLAVEAGWQHGVAHAGSAPAVVVNEIHADPDATAGDANGDGSVESAGDEFVEIVNAEAAALDVSGWTLDDGIRTRHVFPSGTILAAGCGAVVFGGGAPTGGFGAMPVQTASSGSLGLNNGGDTVTLADGGGFVASYTYGAEGGNDESLTRDPDVTGPAPLVRHGSVAGSGGARFSPGTRVDGSAFAGCVGAPSPTGTMAATPTALPSSTPTVTAAGTASVTPTATATPNQTATPVATVTETAAPTASITVAVTPTPLGTSTPVATGTATATPSVTGAPTATPLRTSTPTVTVAATATAQPTPAATPVATTTPTPSRTPLATATATATAVPVSTATVVGTAVPTPAPTVVATLCAPLPEAGCRSPIRSGRGLLVVQDHPVDRRDRLIWKWVKGEATTLDDFGDPRASDPYALCLYDDPASGSALLLAAAIPANDTCSAAPGACWLRASAGARVLRYKRAGGLPDGVERVVLRPGDDGDARIILRARGEALALPALPFRLPVLVQLQGAHGACWESRHGVEGARRNDARMFRGRAQ